MAVGTRATFDAGSSSDTTDSTIHVVQGRMYGVTRSILGYPKRIIARRRSFMQNFVLSCCRPRVGMRIASDLPFGNAKTVFQICQLCLRSACIRRS